jgi:hypothetical protein
MVAGRSRPGGVEVVRDWDRAWDAIKDERDELRADNERLRAEISRALDEPTQNEHDLFAENERLREEMAEWKSAHTAVVELRGLVESHMDMARGEWDCVATIERLRAELLTCQETLTACLECP